MAPKTFDLVTVVLITCVSVATVLSGASYPLIQALCALPLVLFFPGYVVTAALFPPPSIDLSHGSAAFRLDKVENVLLSFGLSLVLTAMCGYMLNLLPSGLSRPSWAIALGTLTVLAAGLAQVRRPASATKSIAGLRSDVRSLVLLVLALILSVGAVSIARNAAIDQAEPGFTQMWMLSSKASGNIALRLGVRSHELSPLRYRLEIKGVAKTILPLGAIALLPGETWETTILLPKKQLNPLSVYLFRVDRPRTVYREVTWKFSSPGSGMPGA